MDAIGGGGDRSPSPDVSTITLEELQDRLKAKQREALQEKRAGNKGRAVALLKEIKVIKAEIAAMTVASYPISTVPKAVLPKQPVPIVEEDLRGQLKELQRSAAQASRTGDKAKAMALLKESKTLKLRIERKSITSTSAASSLRSSVRQVLSTHKHTYKYFMSVFFINPHNYIYLFYIGVTDRRSKCSRTRWY